MNRHRGIRALVAGMCAGSALLLAAFGDAEAVARSPWVTWWLLVPLCALTEVFAVHLPTARNAHTLSLRELPSVLGLAFLSPVGYLAAHLLGAGAALVLHRRQRGIKLAFNLAWFGLEALLGVATYRLLLGGASPAEPRGWAAALGAALLTDLFSAGLVSAVIAVHEREFDFPVLREAVTRGAVAATANICLASLAVVLLVHEPRAVVFLVVVLLVLYVSYRAYVTLSVGHARVELLYRFVRGAGMSVQLDDAVRTVLREARELMRASSAELVMLPHDGHAGTRFALRDDADEVETSAQEVTQRSCWWDPAADGEVVLTGSEADGDDARPGPRGGSLHRYAPATPSSACSWFATGPSRSSRSPRRTRACSGRWPRTPR